MEIIYCDLCKSELRGGSAETVLKLLDIRKAGKLHKRKQGYTLCSISIDVHNADLCAKCKVSEAKRLLLG